MQANEARPPYVTFEYRPIEDRDASIAAGHYVAKDVLFAIITPQGTKDKLEQVADDWFVKLAQAVQEGRFNSEWLKHYKSIRADFEQGREIPEHGTPIITWPAISASQQKAILDANIRTIEDLAVINEAAVNSIGPGARALQGRAIQWLEDAKNGINAERTAALAAENAQLKEQVVAQQAQLESLAKSVAALEKVK